MTTNDETLKRMVAAGLQPPNGSGEPMVQVQGPDGTVQPVPASVGCFLALGSLNQLVQQMNFRLDALHAHAAASSHPNSKAARACPVCTAQNMTPEQVEELKQKMEEAQAAQVAAAEESQEQVQE